MKRLFSAAILAAAFCAEATTPGGIPKKYVGLTFDVMNTTPSNILANADQFAKHAPYLDGVAIGLHDVKIVAGDGSVVTAQYYQIMHPTQRWTRDAVKDQIPILRTLSQTPGLTESFLLFWTTPHKRNWRLDWTDDKAWANFAENMAVAAWLAKQGGMKGLMLDPEEYAGAMQYIHMPQDPPFQKTAELARQRGREVFSRVFKEFPDAVVFSLWFFAKFRVWMEGGRMTTPAIYADDTGELSQYFYNGMIDVMPPEARAVDGCEHYSGSSTDYSYYHNYVSQSTGALAFVAPENWAKFRSQFLFSNTHYLDMYRLDANPKSHWYFGPVNGSRLEHLRLNLEQSLRVATEYVWIYGEGGGKLFDWRGGHYAKQKTWEEVIPGMTETLMLVKDPDGYAAMRKAELKSKKRLVNLAASAKPISLKNPTGVREYSDPEEKMPVVRGVKPGERYLVEVYLRGSVREGAARPRVFWRKNGKRLSVKPTPIPVPNEISGDWTKVEGVVTVPDGADELVLDQAASLAANESVSYRDPSIGNALDPVTRPKAKSPSKWTFDPKEKILTDGNWRLSTWSRDERVFLRGNGTNTVGRGVLDLTSVKADTGLDIYELNFFDGFTGITGLIAPDVPSLPVRSFRNCTNLTCVVVTNLPPGKWANTEVACRRGRLQSMGIWRALLSSAPRTGFTHHPLVRRTLGNDVSVKGVTPGELYSVGLSMKRRGAGVVFASVRFKSGGKVLGSKKAIAMNSPLKDGVWRSGEAVVRIPEGADELYFDIYCELHEGDGYFEFKDFTVYKIGDPPPVWPEESLREKGK
jgi:hypothetical protein